MKARRTILCDLDDTFYLCRPGEEAGLGAIARAASEALGLPQPEVEQAYRAARAAVKSRIDGRGSSHSRLLYLSELVHALGRPDLLAEVRGWERAFWSAFLGAATLRPRVVPFLDAARASGRKIGIVSDLVLEVQLMKLERFDLLRRIDAIAISEEVPSDKPEEAIFRLALARLGATPETCVMVGDHDGKDGEGARRLGVPYVRIAPEDVRGEGFDALARELDLEIDR